MPHLVICAGGGEYKCDDKCPQYKSVSICSHTVAAAESNKEQTPFTKWYRTKRGKRPLNLSAMTMHGIAAGAGRKGSNHPKKKTPSCPQVQTDENSVPLHWGQTNVKTIHTSSSGSVS